MARAECFRVRLVLERTSLVVLLEKLAGIRILANCAVRKGVFDRRAPAETGNNRIRKNKMEMWLTKGMFGDKEKLIVENTENPKKVLEKLYMWKNDENNRKRYKIERYDRFVFGENGTAIDFGDYAWFMLVTGENFESFSKELKRDDKV